MPRDSKSFVVKDDRLFVFSKSVFSNTRQQWVKGEHERQARRAHGQWERLTARSPGRWSIRRSPTSRDGG